MASPVVVFVTVPGRPLYPDDASFEQAAQVRDMIAALHAQSVGTELPTETFAMPFADELVEAVGRAVAGAGDAGPYGASVSALVRANLGIIGALREEMAALQDSLPERRGHFRPLARRAGPREPDGPPGRFAAAHGLG